MTLGPAIFDRHIAAFGEAGFAQALAERGEERGVSARRFAVELSDDWHRRLLRACRERPRGGRTAEEGDKGAATDVDCHVTLPWEVMPMQWEGPYHALSVRSVTTSRSGASPMLTATAKK
jgi:hypothetical protein